jgi:hypothetical protein
MAQRSSTGNVVSMMLATIAESVVGELHSKMEQL